MWAQAIATALGVGLMASPVVFGYAGPAATNHYTIGPVVATLAFLSMWEVLRGIRWGNLPLGVWLVLCPLLIEHSATALFTSVVAGLAIAVLSALAPSPTEDYGGGWRALWKT